MIAFWDGKSRGTKIMIEVAKEKGLKVYGGHWDRNDPDHQVVCRIIVDGEEIYIGADQGTTTQDTEVYIHGPVYIPQKDNN